MCICWRLIWISPLQCQWWSKHHNKYGVVTPIIQPLHLASYFDTLVTCEAYLDSPPSRFRLQILDAEGFHPWSKYNKQINVGRAELPFFICLSIHHCMCRQFINVLPRPWTQLWSGCMCYVYHSSHFFFCSNILINYWRLYMPAGGNNYTSNWVFGWPWRKSSFSGLLNSFFLIE